MSPSDYERTEQGDDPWCPTRLTDRQLQILMEQWQPAAVEIQTLRARVAKLEAALLDCKRYAEDHDDEWVPHRVDDALKDAPQCS